MVEKFNLVDFLVQNFSVRDVFLVLNLKNIILILIYLFIDFLIKLRALMDQARRLETANYVIELELSLFELRVYLIDVTFSQ